MSNERVKMGARDERKAREELAISSWGVATVTSQTTDLIASKKNCWTERTFVGDVPNMGGKGDE